MAAQCTAAKQPAVSSNGPASRTPEAERQLAVAEALWPLLLQHDSMWTQLPVVCRLLCCSKSTAAAVADHSAGQLDIPRVQQSTAATIVAWLRKHAALARSVDLVGGSYYDDVAISASVAAVLVAAQPQTLKLQSLKACSNDATLLLLEQLPASFLTHLELRQADEEEDVERQSDCLGRLTALRTLTLQNRAVNDFDDRELPGLLALRQLTHLCFHSGPVSDLEYVPPQLLELSIGYHDVQQPLCTSHLTAVTALTRVRLTEQDELPPNLLRLYVSTNCGSVPLLPLQQLQELQLMFDYDTDVHEDITADQLRQHSDLRALSRIYLRITMSLDPASAGAWPQLPRLQRLELAGVDLSASVCQHLSQLKLTSLRLQDFVYSESDSAQQLASALRQLSGLQQLELSAPFVASTVQRMEQRAAGMQQLVQAIGSLQQLQKLDCHLNAELAAAAERIPDSLTALTSLTALSLARCRLTDAIVAAIVAQVPGLQSLDCSRNKQLTDAALPAIGQLQQLTELLLCDTCVTDGGLQQLCGLVRLKKLDAMETSVTNAGLCHLTGLLRLQELCVPYGVTKQQRRWLKKQLPDLCIK